MRYFLYNIAQSSIARSIFVILAGLLVWVVNLVQADAAWSTKLLAAGLVVVNSVLLMQVFYKTGITNLPSAFVGCTYWIVFSAIAIHYPAWQVQLLITGCLVSWLILQRMRYQEEPVEEAFLTTLICCCTTLVIYLKGVIILILWIYLLLKGKISWRAWVASLMAIATYALFAYIFHYLGWTQTVWGENLPQLPWLEWVILIALGVVTFLTIYFPIRKPSAWSGLTHILYVSAVLGISVFGHHINDYIEKIINIKLF